MEVTAIHIAQVSQAPMESVDAVEAVAGHGLVGDRKAGGHRPITIVSQDELDDASVKLGEPIKQGSTRRNVTVRGLRLPREEGVRIRLGEVLIEIKGDCSPCDVLEGSVGPGARSALQGLAGVTADIIEGGTLHIGDAVAVEQ